MSPRSLTAIRIDEELLEAMREIAERDGILVPEQVRRGIRLWLAQKGAEVPKQSSKPKARKRRSS